MKILKQKFHYQIQMSHPMKSQFHTKVIYFNSIGHAVATQILFNPWLWISLVVTCHSQ